MKISSHLPLLPSRPPQMRPADRSEQPALPGDANDGSVLSGKIEAPPKTEVAGSSAAEETSATWKSALKTTDRHKGSFLVLGFGSKRQYKEPEVVQRALDQLVEGLDAQYGKSRWLAVFGGGEIAGQEALFARQKGVPVHYIRAEARLDGPGGNFGAIDEMLR